MKTDAYLQSLLTRKSENDAAIRELKKTGKLIQNAIKAIQKVDAGQDGKPKRRKKAAATSTAAA